MSGGVPKSSRAALADAGRVVAALLPDQLREIQLHIAGLIAVHPRLTPDERAAALGDVLDALGIRFDTLGRHPEQGTIFGYWRHVTTNELPCRPCWTARMTELERMWGVECPMIPREEQLRGEESTTDVTSRTSS